MPMFGLFKKRQLPKRVLLLSGLPDSREAFMRAAETGHSDFLRSLADTYGVRDVESLWNCYKPTASALLTTFRKVESRGGMVVSGFTLRDVAAVNHYDVVIVIAHHSDNSDEIESVGNMIGSTAFVGAIPSDTRAVIDLTSCYSAYLIPKIKGHIPASKIIGITVQTKLTLRLYLLEKVLEELACHPQQSYIEALQTVISQLPSTQGSLRLKDATPDVRLGSKLSSTVFAPKEAKRGEDFIVSVFMHKQDDSDEVELMARAIDESLTKKVTKRITFKVKNGDKVDFQFVLSKQMSESFHIDKHTKGLVWDGDINSVEFIVSVDANCSASSFIGKIKMSINKEPVADMVFATAITSSPSEATGSCASIDFVPFDKAREMNQAKTSLISRLDSRISDLSGHHASHNDDDAINSELAMCLKCKEILEATPHPGSNSVLRVFISSTSDMKQYRDILRQRVEACEMYPDMYENWGQGNDYPRDVCCKHVMQSDIFICILGAKYGFVEPIWDKSMTEIEYRIALNAGLPILIYIVANYRDEISRLEKADRQLAHRQEKLIEEVTNSRMVGMFLNELGLSLLANSELLTIKHKLDYERTTER